MPRSPTHPRYKIGSWVQQLQRYADRWWYAPLIAALAFLDTFFLIIPNDGILISSAMMKPRRWLLFALSITIGSTLGGLSLYIFVQLKGLPWVLNFYPGILETTTWSWTAKFFSIYGLYVIFAIAMTPSFQQPGIIIASITGTPVFHFLLASLSGRFIKFLLMAYIGSHAPQYLRKLWGVRRELKSVGVQLEKEKKKIKEAG